MTISHPLGIPHQPITGGALQLLQSAGSDLAFVNAARVSFGATSEFLQQRDEALLGYLMRNKHASPFEHGQITFYIKAPIFVFREWHRHRTQSYNEMSGRYTEMKPEFYVPDVPRRRVGKPGHYTTEDITDPDIIHTFQSDMRKAYATAWAWYEDFLSEGLAPELARSVLPVGTFSQMWATANPRNWLNFMTLRTDPTAQWEIRQYAFAVEKEFGVLFPITYAHWVKEGRCSL